MDCKSASVYEGAGWLACYAMLLFLEKMKRIKRPSRREQNDANSVVKRDGNLNPGTMMLQSGRTYLLLAFILNGPSAGKVYVWKASYHFVFSNETK